MPLRRVLSALLETTRFRHLLAGPRELPTRVVLPLPCQKFQQFHSDLVLRRPRSSRGRLEGRRLGLAFLIRDAARRARLLTMKSPSPDYDFGSLQGTLALFFVPLVMQKDSSEENISIGRI